MKFQAKVTDVTKIEADLLAVFAGSEEARKVDGAEEFANGEQGGHTISSFSRQYSGQAGGYRGIGKNFGVDRF